MKIYAMLPPDRQAEGSVWAVADGNIIWGPERCRGEADNTGAFKAGNVQEDPTRAFGDHPYGVSLVTEIVRKPSPAKSYGPVFIRLNPVSGEAWEAKRNGRTGIGIHGGDLSPDGDLRATYGCLRLTNEAVLSLAVLIEIELYAGREIFYEAIPHTSLAHMSDRGVV